MIMLILTAVLLGALAGYLLAEAVDGIMIQVQANQIRKQVGLATKPVQFRK